MGSGCVRPLLLTERRAAHKGRSRDLPVSLRGEKAHHARRGGHGFFRTSSFGLGEALAQLVSDHTDSETRRTAARLIRSRITQALSQMAVSGVWAPEEEAGA